MKLLAGILLLPLLMNSGSRGNEKIDQRLLRKTRTMGGGILSAIVFSKENQEPVCKAYLKSKGIKIKYELPLIQAYAVELPGDELVQMAGVDAVAYVSDDVKTSALLNVAVQVVGARIANEAGYTGSGIGIAVLDTGIYPHPDFTHPRNRITAFKDFVRGRTQPYDDNGHGTFVAGVAAGNGYASNGRYAGVAPDADIIGIKVMDERGSGNSSDIVAGMQWAVDNRQQHSIRVMCLSLGARASGSRYDPLAAAVEAVWRQGIVVAVAAGNNGPNRGTITTPGVSASVITVGAVDDKRTVDTRDDTVAEFSSRGPALGRLYKPDIMAPGVNLTAANTDKAYTGHTRAGILDAPYRSMSGTSVATPIAAGAAALMLQKNPQAAPAQVKQAITRSAVKMSAGRLQAGYGILNVPGMLGLDERMSLKP